MTQRQAAMWQTLSDLPLGDAGAVITFEDKLRRQTGWPRKRVERVVEEYRRFLLLAGTAGHPVSPSPAVDEAWHLHLLYTRSYWDTLCPKVLGFDLHHEPATGQRDDRAKLDDWYARTLVSYRQAFGEPPADLWPATPVDRPFARVDPSHSVVLPRLAWRVMMGLGLLTALLLIVSLSWIAIHLHGSVS